MLSELQTSTLDFSWRDIVSNIRYLAASSCGGVIASLVIFMLSDYFLMLPNLLQLQEWWDEVFLFIRLCFTAKVLLLLLCS